MCGNGEKKLTEGIVYKAYVITEGKKVYIDPEYLKRSAFNPHELYIFTGRRIYIEKN